MDKLLELGFNDNEIGNIIKENPNILNISKEEINNKIKLLIYIGCKERHITNIIISNPGYLTKEYDEIILLIKYLKEIGLKNLYLLFDTNPFLLTKDTDDIQEYIDNKLKTGILLEDIIDELDNNPYIIDEE